MERICWGLLCAAGSCLCGFFGTEAAKTHKQLEMQDIPVHIETFDDTHMHNNIGSVPSATDNSWMLHIVPIVHEQMPRL